MAQYKKKLPRQKFTDQNNTGRQGMDPVASCIHENIPPVGHPSILFDTDLEGSHRSTSSKLS